MAGPPVDYVTQYLGEEVIWLYKFHVNIKKWKIYQNINREPFRFLKHLHNYMTSVPHPKCRSTGIRISALADIITRFFFVQTERLLKKRWLMMMSQKKMMFSGRCLALMQPKCVSIDEQMIPIFWIMSILTISCIYQISPMKLV